jgi:hypothetical protein
VDRSAGPAVEAQRLHDEERGGRAVGGGDLVDGPPQIQEVLRAPGLRQPPSVQSAYAAIVSGQVRLIAALNTEIGQLGEVVAAHFGHHPDAEIYASQPASA